MTTCYNGYLSSPGATSARRCLQLPARRQSTKRVPVRFLEFRRRDGTAAPPLLLLFSLIGVENSLRKQWISFIRADALR